MADTDHLPSNSYIPQSGGLGRPVDRRQERYQPSGRAARRVPPHGDVSPDGSRVWPQPSMTSRVLVYGGAAVAAAAATAGAVLAVRKVADLVTGDDDLHRHADDEAERARARVYDEGRNRPTSGRRTPPHMVAMREREREAMRARARARMREDEAERGRIRSDARHTRDESRKSRRPRPGIQPMSFLDDVEHTAQRLTRTVNEVVTGLGAAVAAFRSVAAQAQGVMRDFHGAADQVRSFLDTNQGADAKPTPRRDPYRRPPRRDVVDLRDPEESTAARDDTAMAAGDSGRTHRL